MRALTRFIVWVFAVAGIVAATSAPGGTRQAETDHSDPTVIILHVAPNGNDSNDGMAVAASGGHGPLRSIERARDLARTLRTPGHAVTIALSTGDYPLARSLVLDARDSGRPGAPTVIASEPGAVARIVGGSSVTGWHADNTGELVTGWPGECPSQMFVDGRRASRPRLPATGWYKIAGLDASGPSSASENFGFAARPGDLPKSLDVSPSTEILILDAWTASRLRVESYDPTRHQLQLRGHFAGHGTHNQMSVGLPYAIENAPTRHLAPGTWQCDRARAILRYRPLQGQALGSFTIFAPLVEQLVQVKGTPDAPVHDITLRNIAFEYTGWSLPANGWAAMQAEVGLPGAIEIASARNISLDGLAISHTAATGVRIGLDSADVTLSHSRLTDIGGNGIAVGTEQRKPLPGSNWTGGTSARWETYRITIESNVLSKLGRVQPGAVGIWSGQAHHVAVLNNRISDLFYTGISMGWVWNDGPSLSHDNLVSGNIVENFGQGVMSDFGGIYTLGQMPRTLITGNQISHGHARLYGARGLYADQDSGGIRFTRNSVSDTSQAPVQVTRGNDLVFADNVFSNFADAVIYCDQPSPGESVQFLNNRGSTRIVVPATLGACGNGSYAISALVLSTPQGTRRVSKPFGVSRDDADFAPVVRPR